MTGLALLAGTLAAWLACRPIPSSSMLHDRRPGRLLALGAAAAVLLVWLLVMPVRAGALAGLIVAVAWAGSRLWQRRAARLAAAADRAKIREACDHLAAELVAGLSPGVALRRVAEGCAALRPAAEAFELGGSVPDALRDAACTPGHADLRLLAAGWQVAHRTGSGLAGAVEHIADMLRADLQTARLVAGELASARATARLVAALPVLSLAMGAGAGGSPWSFLLTTTAGTACLAGGLLLGLAGLWWIEALTGDVS